MQFGFAAVAFKPFFGLHVALSLVLVVFSGISVFFNLVSFALIFTLIYISQKFICV